MLVRWTIHADEASAYFFCNCKAAADRSHVKLCCPLSKLGKGPSSMNNFHAVRRCEDSTSRPRFPPSLICDLAAALDRRRNGPLNLPQLPMCLLWCSAMAGRCLTSCFLFVKLAIAPFSEGLISEKNTQYDIVMIHRKGSLLNVKSFPL